MRKALFFCALLVASLSHAQPGADPFDADIGAIVELVASGKISRTEGTREMLQAAKAHYPSDTVLHAYYESLLSYAQRLESGELTHQQAMELVAFRTERFNLAMAARSKKLEDERAQIASEQKEVDEYNALRRRLAAEAMQQEIERQNRAQATGALLHGIGRAFRNAYGQR